MSALRALTACAAAVLLAAPLSAQEGPFGAGWVLRPEASALTFQSVKNGSKVEASSFATMTGAVEPGGEAALSILLDSVDTKVDLRNVRMRFLFFETFLHPEARVALHLDPALPDELRSARRMVVRVPYELTLHGVTRALEADLAVTLIGEDLVSVSTAAPILLTVEEFGLTEGLRKLEEASGATIVPSTTVTFDLIFDAAAPDAPAALTLAAAAPAAPAEAALEEEGDFSREACVGRFEILSRSGNISFAPGSARLDEASRPLLESVADIVSRCPDLSIRVAGHTDSVGAEAANQALSERRAASVAAWLAERGIAADRFTSVGFGEAQPIAGNDTPEGRSRNRRIEFSVAPG